jgi:hypothetical protein
MSRVYARVILRGTVRFVVHVPREVPHPDPSHLPFTPRVAPAMIGSFPL